MSWNWLLRCQSLHLRTQLQCVDRHMFLEELAEKSDHLLVLEQRVLRRRWWSSMRNVSTTTWGGTSNDAPPPPISPEAGDPLSHGGRMIGSHVNGVGLPLISYRHQAQVNLVSDEIYKFVVYLERYGTAARNTRLRSRLCIEDNGVVNSF